MQQRDRKMQQRSPNITPAGTSTNNASTTTTTTTAAATTTTTTTTTTSTTATNDITHVTTLDRNLGTDGVWDAVEAQIPSANSLLQKGLRVDGIVTSKEIADEIDDKTYEMLFTSDLARNNGLGFETLHEQDKRQKIHCVSFRVTLKNRGGVIVYRGLGVFCDIKGKNILVVPELTPHDYDRSTFLNCAAKYRELIDLYKNMKEPQLIIYNNNQKKMKDTNPEFLITHTRTRTIGRNKNHCFLFDKSQEEALQYVMDFMLQACVMNKELKMLITGLPGTGKTSLAYEILRQYVSLLSNGEIVRQSKNISECRIACIVPNKEMAIRAKADNQTAAQSASQSNDQPQVFFLTWREFLSQCDQIDEEDMVDESHFCEWLHEQKGNFERIWKQEKNRDFPQTIKYDLVNGNYDKIRQEARVIPADENAYKEFGKRKCLYHDKAEKECVFWLLGLYRRKLENTKNKNRKNGKSLVNPDFHQISSEKKYHLVVSDESQLRSYQCIHNILKISEHVIFCAGPNQQANDAISRINIILEQIAELTEVQPDKYHFHHVFLTLPHRSSPNQAKMQEAATDLKLVCLEGGGIDRYSPISLEIAPSTAENKPVIFLKENLAAPENVATRNIIRAKVEAGKKENSVAVLVPYEANRSQAEELYATYMVFNITEYIGCDNKKIIFFIPDDTFLSEVNNIFPGMEEAKKRLEKMKELQQEAKKRLAAGEEYKSRLPRNWSNEKIAPLTELDLFIIAISRALEDGELIINWPAGKKRNPVRDWFITRGGAQFTFDAKTKMENSSLETSAATEIDWKKIADQMLESGEGHVKQARKFLLLDQKLNAADVQTYFNNKLIEAFSQGRNELAKKIFVEGLAKNLEKDKQEFLNLKNQYLTQSANMTGNNQPQTSPTSKISSSLSKATSKISSSLSKAEIGKLKQLLETDQTPQEWKKVLSGNSLLLKLLKTPLHNGKHFMALVMEKSDKQKKLCQALASQPDLVLSMVPKKDNLKKLDLQTLQDYLELLAYLGKIADSKANETWLTHVGQRQKDVCNSILIVSGEQKIDLIRAISQRNDKESWLKESIIQCMAKHMGVPDNQIQIYLPKPHLPSLTEQGIFAQQPQTQSKPQSQSFDDLFANDGILIREAWNNHPTSARFLDIVRDLYIKYLLKPEIGIINIEKLCALKLPGFDPWNFQLYSSPDSNLNLWHQACVHPSDAMAKCLFKHYPESFPEEKIDKEFLLKAAILNGSNLNMQWLSREMDCRIDLQKPDNNSLLEEMLPEDFRKIGFALPFCFDLESCDRNKSLLLFHLKNDIYHPDLCLQFSELFVTAVKQSAEKNTGQISLSDFPETEMHWCKCLYELGIGRSEKSYRTLLQHIESQSTLQEFPQVVPFFEEVMEKIKAESLEQDKIKSLFLLCLKKVDNEILIDKWREILFNTGFENLINKRDLFENNLNLIEHLRFQKFLDLCVSFSKVFNLHPHLLETLIPSVEIDNATKEKSLEHAYLLLFIKEIFTDQYKSYEKLLAEYDQNARQIQAEYKFYYHQCPDANRRKFTASFQSDLNANAAQKKKLQQSFDQVKINLDKLNQQTAVIFNKITDPVGFLYELCEFSQLPMSYLTGMILYFLETLSLHKQLTSKFTLDAFCQPISDKNPSSLFDLVKENDKATTSILLKIMDWNGMPGNPSSLFKILTSWDEPEDFFVMLLNQKNMLEYLRSYMPSEEFFKMSGLIPTALEKENWEQAILLFRHFKGKLTPSMHAAFLDPISKGFIDAILTLDTLRTKKESLEQVQLLSSLKTFLLECVYEIGGAALLNELEKNISELASAEQKDKKHICAEFQKIRTKVCEDYARKDSQANANTNAGKSQSTPTKNSHPRRPRRK